MIEEKKNWLRRHWILAGLMIFIILVMIIGIFNSNSTSETLVIRYDEVANASPVYQKQMSEIEHKYNIDLEYKNPPNSSYHGSNFVLLSESDESKLAKYVSLFYREFNRYPQDFIKNVDLRKVAFVKNLSVGGQYRAAEADSTNEVLFYDVHIGSYNETYQKGVIHHEFYHMIEEEINGDPYYQDPVWASFNDPNFKYGSGGTSAYDDSGYENKVLEAGFISVYSTYALEEDKAEIFANLMVPELAKEMHSKANNDTILDKKIDYMKNFISKYSEHMNEDFWQTVSLS